MKIDIDNLQKYIDEKLISVQKHPTEELFIYNYTQICQFKGVWDDTTLMCRGLITDKEGNVIARPFKKFFNVQEVENKLPDGDYEVWEKMDGSLGILYWVGDTPYIATRGSFTSDQAKKGTEMLHERYKSIYKYFDRNKTYLFEIIYPSNRIVVDYKDKEELILLAIIDVETGEEESILTAIPMEKAKRYTQMNLEHAMQVAPQDSEGFVLRWQNGYRLKYKFEEYVRLHRLLTQVTRRTIWDLLRNKQPFDELLDRIPDEFFQWVKNTESELRNEYKEIEDVAKLAFQTYDLHNMTRKEAAEIITTRYKKFASVIFLMLDNRDYSHEIWGRLKPPADKPFKQDEV